MWQQQQQQQQQHQQAYSRGLPPPQHPQQQIPLQPGIIGMDDRASSYQPHQQQHHQHQPYQQQHHQHQPHQQQHHQLQPHQQQHHQHQHQPHQQQHHQHQPHQQQHHQLQPHQQQHHQHQPHQQQHHQLQHHQQHPLAIMPAPSINPRASRNMAEKQRRDNLNANISKMATLVPSVANSSKKMDKISILRLTTAFLRTRYTLGSGSKNFLPPMLKKQFDLEKFFDHLTDNGGFFLIVTAAGKIVYVSRQVEQHLGHVQNDLLGQSLYNFVYPEDHDVLTHNLTPDGMQPMSTVSPRNIAQVSEHDSSSSEEVSTMSQRMSEKLSRFREQRRHFKIRIAQRASSRRDHTHYECFEISGLLRLADACRNANRNMGRLRETMGTSNDIVFAGMATLPKKRPITELSIIDVNKDEYVTRHLIDGRIIYCDHRVSVVAGYLSEEVSGLNAFAFMHKDDFRWTMIGLRQKTSTSNDIVFAGMATLPKKRPITELSLIDVNKDEYVTRHLIDGRIIYCDHRVSVVAGYLSEEVSGLNAFAFMHKDDFRWTMIGLRQMYDRAETCGSSCYRLLTKNNQFIFLKTHGYLEFDKNSQTVESFVCVNTLVSQEEGIQLIKEMKAKYSAIVSACQRGFIRGIDINAPIELSLSNARCLEDPAQLEDAITHLISDLPSPIISENHFSPIPDIQYVKAAMLSSHMPPAVVQANKIGISKIDHCVVIQSKGKTPKQESKHTIGKLINPNSAEQSQMSDSENAMSTGKPLSMFEMMNATNSHGNVQTADMSGQSKIPAALKSGKSHCASHNHNTLCLDVPQNANVLNAQEIIDQRNMDMSSSTLNDGSAYNIKVERGIEEPFNCLEKQEAVMQYFNNSTSDSSIVSSRIEMHNRCPLKRTCSDEDLLAMHSKKRPNNVYASPNENNEQQCNRPFLKCRSFATYNDVNSQPLTMTESPNSNPNEIGTDYQQLMDPTMQLVVTNHDKEQLIELQTLKDTLLSSELDENPDLKKLFDNVHSESAGFENFSEPKIQLTFDDLQQVVNDELSRTYCKLTDNIVLQESQINVLTHDLKNPALHTQREDLSQLQVEHNVQKQMFKTLQQDHCKMQM